MSISRLKFYRLLLPALFSIGLFILPTIASAQVVINEIVHGLRAISADTALRLGKYFSISPQFWLNLQSHFDLEIESAELASILKDDVKIFEFVV